MDRRSTGALAGDSSYRTFRNLSDREATHRMRMALARMSGGFGKFVTTPLWDYGKLLKRIVSKQDYMPAKKEDDGNPVILFLCDTSGSCDEISEQSTKIAQSASILGVRGADVWVVFHDDLVATTDDAMHNGKHIGKELDQRINKLKEHGNMTQNILAAIRPQLVINITDMDSIKMNLDVLALGKWRTLVLDTCKESRWRPAPTPERGRFYTLDALIRQGHGVSYSSYYRMETLISSHIRNLYGESYRQEVYFPSAKTLPQATILANRYLTWSFHNTSVSAICASINDYASPDRMARLIVR